MDRLEAGLDLSGNDAIAALAFADPDQNVDEADWLQLGALLIDIVPERLSTFNDCIKALTSDWPLIRQREIDVRLARLGARALHARGDLAGALDMCCRAHYSLDGCFGDDFIEHELPWLIEAKRLEEAGQRAFRYVYHRPEIMPVVALLLHQRLADASDHTVWWPLCVMSVCHTDTELDRFVSAAPTHGADLRRLSPVHERLFAAFDQGGGEAVRRAVFVAAHALADERSPRHPWAVRLATIRASNEGHLDAAKKLAELRWAVIHGPIRDHLTERHLLATRTALSGLVETLRLPPAVLPSGQGCYAYAVAVGEFVEAQLPSLPHDEHNDAWVALNLLQTQLYEQGLAHWERYIVTGVGHPYDACTHTYSMLCNNLAILYTHEGSHNRAIELHRRGIEASPFAEHYDGLLRSQLALESDAGIVEAAEALWVFTEDHGYSRHDPHEYIGAVGRALYDLDRDSEIPVWLERLVHWQHQAGERDDDLSAEALEDRLTLAFFMATRLSDDATALWRQLAHQVITSQDYWLIGRGGEVLDRLGRRAEAVPLYEQALAFNPGHTEVERARAAKIGIQLAAARAAASASEPTKAAWQFWK